MTDKGEDVIHEKGDEIVDEVHSGTADGKGGKKKGRCVIS